jgi:NDP-sugar pyrophosphorylase family protein
MFCAEVTEREEMFVGLGAVVTIGARNQEFSRDRTGLAELPGIGQEPFLDVPLECVEVAGRSLLERMIERFVATGLERVSVLLEAKAFTRLPKFRTDYANVTVKVVRDLYPAVTQELADYSQNGIGHSFISSANAYAETDLLDLLCFHREARQAATRAFDKEGPLDLWVVDCAKAQRGDVESFLDDAGRDGASKYFIRDYVNRLAHLRDLRRFAADILRRSCETGPSGKQVRPGVWMDEGAEVHRRARIVAPAFIGCASKVKADALITRLSNIERDCCVDSGTVVEDSSILANTTVGICLDLCHAVTSGNKLWNLEREVTVQIVDPSVMRFSFATRKAAALSSEQIAAPEATIALPKPQMPETWQFNSSLIQE